MRIRIIMIRNQIKNLLQNQKIKKQKSAEEQTSTTIPGFIDITKSRDKKSTEEHSGGHHGGNTTKDGLGDRGDREFRDLTGSSSSDRFLSPPSSPHYPSHLSVHEPKTIERKKSVSIDSKVTGSSEGRSAERERDPPLSQSGGSTKQLYHETPIALQYTPPAHIPQLVPMTVTTPPPPVASIPVPVPKEAVGPEKTGSPQASVLQRRTSTSPEGSPQSRRSRFQRENQTVPNVARDVERGSRDPSSTTDSLSNSGSGSTSEKKSSNRMRLSLPPPSRSINATSKGRRASLGADSKKSISGLSGSGGGPDPPEQQQGGGTGLLQLVKVEAPVLEVSFEDSEKSTRGEEGSPPHSPTTVQNESLEDEQQQTNKQTTRTGNLTFSI